MSMVIFSHNSNGINPDVSVIIPTYNRIAMLEEALASVSFQQFNGVVEVIVTDDNSRDGTSEIIRQKYPFVRLISLKRNVGPGAARNRALLRARGRYIAFLDSDDLWKPNHLKTQIAAIEGNNRCFGVSDLVIWDVEQDCKQLKLQRPDLKQYASTIHHLFVSTFISTPSSVVIPRQALDEIGLFDENFRLGGEDPDLYLRCLLHDYGIAYTEQPTTVQRKHNQSQVTDVTNLKLKEKHRFMRINKNYAMAKERFDIVPIQQIYAEAHAFFAREYFNNNDFLHWLTSSIAVAYHASPQNALFNAISNVKHRTSHSLRHWKANATVPVSLPMQDKASVSGDLNLERSR